MEGRLDRVRTEVLSMATEDLNGLWESWWAVNTLFPDLALSERLALAEQAVLGLLDSGLIRLYRGSWTEQSPVAADAIASTLREAGSWVAQDEDDLTFFLATDAGQQAYLSP